MCRADTPVQASGLGFSFSVFRPRLTSCVIQPCGYNTGAVRAVFPSVPWRTCHPNPGLMHVHMHTHAHPCLHTNTHRFRLLASSRVVGTTGPCQHTWLQWLWEDSPGLGRATRHRPQCTGFCRGLWRASGSPHPSLPALCHPGCPGLFPAL